MKMNFYNNQIENYVKEKNKEIYKYTEDTRTLGKFAYLTVGKKVLDLGAGFGNSYNYFKQTKELWLLDNSEKFVESMNQNIKSPEVQIICSDAIQTGFPNQYFDVVVCNGVIHEIDPQKILKEANRVLKQGGLLLVFEPLKKSKHFLSNPLSLYFSNFFEEKNRNGEYIKAHSKDYEFSFQELSSLLYDNGFQWITVKNSWFKILPFVHDNSHRFWIHFNYVLSDILESFILQGKGKNVHGYCVKLSSHRCEYKWKDKK